MYIYCYVLIENKNGLGGRIYVKQTRTTINRTKGLYAQ